MQETKQLQAKTKTENKKQRPQKQKQQNKHAAGNTREENKLLISRNNLPDTTAIHITNTDSLPLAPQTTSKIEISHGLSTLQSPLPYY
jgi:hypothetical protein